MAKRIKIEDLSTEALKIESNDYLDVLVCWIHAGRDMMQVFNSMTRKETLQVIDHIVLSVDETSLDDSDLYDLYKIAMTSLENRL